MLDTAWTERSRQYVDMYDELVMNLKIVKKVLQVCDISQKIDELSFENSTTNDLRVVSMMLDGGV